MERVLQHNKCSDLLLRVENHPTERISDHHSEIRVMEARGKGGDRVVDRYGPSYRGIPKTTMYLMRRKWTENDKHALRQTVCIAGD
jgi:hypothetical protein